MLPHISQPFEFIHFRSLKDLPHLLIVIFLVFGIGLGVYLALQPQIFNKRADEGAVVDLKILPEKLEVEIGKEYEVKVAINPKGHRVTGARLNIRYDPSVTSVLQVNNGGFLPVQLRVENDQQGNLDLIYGSTVDSIVMQPGVICAIKFKVLNLAPGFFEVVPTSEVTIASVEGNILKTYPRMDIEPKLATSSGKEVSYPDNLLLEKAFFASSEPALRDFRESLDPEPELKPGRIKPEFSPAFIKQLAVDIFISPIAALNQVLEEKTGEILGK